VLLSWLRNDEVLSLHLKLIPNQQLLYFFFEDSSPFLLMLFLIMIILELKLFEILDYLLELGGDSFGYIKRQEQIKLVYMIRVMIDILRVFGQLVVGLFCFTVFANFVVLLKSNLHYLTFTHFRYLFIYYHLKSISYQDSFAVE
jgi:hypothetical protein